MNICKMCFIPDRLDLFLFLMAEIQAFFAAKPEHTVSGWLTSATDIPHLGHVKTTARTLLGRHASIFCWIVP